MFPLRHIPYWLNRRAAAVVPAVRHRVVVPWDHRREDDPWDRLRVVVLDRPLRRIIVMVPATLTKPSA
ncbi:hypothetical protein FACS1894189_4890 [Planctomycetales bacterium]|nr:hypothetical protein FACS1894189_4890 [Planctomycetales bacterium]